MKNSYFALLALLIGLNCHGQWQHQTNGIGESPVSCFGMNGTMMFAGTYYYLFFSANEGILWEKNWYGSWHSAPANIRAIGSTPGIQCILGTNQGLVYGYGSTLNEWSHFTGVPNNSQIYSIKVNGPHIFAGSQNGLFISTDEGSTYTQCTGIPGNETVFAIDFAGDVICAGTNYGVYVSMDNGSTWVKRTEGLALSPGSCVQAMAISGTDMFAGTSLDGVFYSGDYGNTWSAVNPGLTVSGISSLAAIGPNIFAGTTNGVFLLHDHGNSWSDVSGELANLNVYALIIAGERIFAGVQDGVWSGMLSGFQIQSPEAETLDATSVDQRSALLHGSVYPNCMPTVCVFEYGESTAYGNARVYPGPPLSGPGKFVTDYLLDSIKSNTKYHYRVTATNSFGTSAGADKQFTTNNSGIEPAGNSFRGEVSPNPASDKIIIEVRNLPAFRKVTGTIVDLNGKAMMRQPILSSKTEFLIRRLSKGIYFLRIEGPEGYTVIKFIKE